MESLASGGAKLGCGGRRLVAGETPSSASGAFPSACIRRQERKPAQLQRFQKTKACTRMVQRADSSAARRRVEEVASGVPLASHRSTDARCGRKEHPPTLSHFTGKEAQDQGVKKLLQRSSQKLLARA
eukprot:scaffold574_cov246-Pinguiococcus_pyrenoidosus.AAC.14